MPDCSEEIVSNNVLLRLQEKQHNTQDKKISKRIPGRQVIE